MYIGSLQWWTSDAEIEALCAPHGAVQKIRFFEEKPSGKSKGYCLVTFDSPKGAYLCRQSLDGCVLLALLCTRCTHNVYSNIRVTCNLEEMYNGRFNAYSTGYCLPVLISRGCTCHPSSIAAILTLQCARKAFLVLEVLCDKFSGVTARKS